MYVAVSFKGSCHNPTFFVYSGKTWVGINYLPWDEEPKPDSARDARENGEWQIYHQGILPLRGWQKF